MRIAICDDHERERNALAADLAEYCARRGTELTVKLFDSAFMLTQAITAGHRFDLLLLDILMPGMDGFAAAKEIRCVDQRVAIAFLTVSPDYALASYSVKARHYLIKPVSRDALFSLLDEVDAELAQEEKQMLVIDTKAGLRRLGIDRLEYCEVIGRTIFYHMTNGAVFEGRGNLHELERRLLVLPNFLKPHRSYLVNIDHIAGVNSRDYVIEMQSLKQIPIPKVRCGEVREFIRHYVEQKGVVDHEKA